MKQSPNNAATDAATPELERARLATRRRRRNALLLLGAAGVVLWMRPMGLLLWARLRILTSIPRTAVAQPEPVAGSELAPGAPDAPR